MNRNGAQLRKPVASSRAATNRQPFTFLLDPGLVEQARQEVGETDMVRSIEAALVAAIDYQHWIREISRGESAAYS